MPRLTLDQVRRLRERGITPQNSFAVPLSDRSGALNTFKDTAISAAAAVIPTAAGFLGGTIGSVAGPVGTGVGALVGGGAASFAQDVILPKFMERAITKARMTSPDASFLGEFVPGFATALPGKTAGLAVKGIANLRSKASRKAMSQLEKDALMNVTLGASVESGVEGSMQLLAGEDLDLGRVGLAGLLGGSQTDLTGIGRGLSRAMRGQGGGPNFFNRPDATTGTPGTNPFRKGRPEQPEQPGITVVDPGPPITDLVVVDPGGRLTLDELNPTGGGVSPINKRRLLPNADVPIASKPISERDVIDVETNEVLDSPTHTALSTDIPPVAGELQPPVPGRVVREDLTEMEVVPTNRGDNLQKPTETVRDNVTKTDPVASENLQKVGNLTDREVGMIDPVSAKDSSDWVSSNKMDPKGKNAILKRARKSGIAEGDGMDKILDQAAIQYDRADGDYDQFVNRMDGVKGYDPTDVPPSMLHKLIRSVDPDPQEFNPTQEFNFGPGNPAVLAARLKDTIARTGRKIGDFLSPAIDKLSRVNKGGAYVSRKLTKAMQDEREIYGTFTTDLSNRLAKFRTDTQLRRGKEWTTTGFKNPTTRSANAQLQDIQQVMSDEFDGGLGSSKIQLNAEQREIYDMIRDIYKKFRVKQNDDGLPIKTPDGQGARKGRENEQWMPMSMRKSILDGLNSVHKDGVDIIAVKNDLKKEYLDYAEPKFRARGSKDPSGDALKDWNAKFGDNFNKGGKSKQASKFGPMDLAEGIGIPASWRDLDLIDTVTRYNRGASKRLAFWNNLESDPASRVALGLEGDLWVKNPNTGPQQPDFVKLTKDEVLDLAKKTDGAGIEDGSSFLRTNPDAKHLMDTIQGERSQAHPQLEAWSALVKSVRMGPLTGAKDLASMSVISSTYLTPETVARLGIAGAKNIAKKRFKIFNDAKKSISKNIARGMEKGVITRDIGNTEAQQEITGGVTEKLYDSANWLNKVSGRSGLERVSRGANFGIGKFAALDMSMALSGQKAITNNQSRKQMERFFELFSPDGVDWRDKYIKKGKGNIPQEDLDHIAARFVEATQGTYDNRGLPSWALAEGISPFFSLMRWPLERSINAYKHIVAPMGQGNYMPAMMTMAGAAGAGPLMIGLTEMFNGGRKSNEASLEELYNMSDTTGEVQVSEVGYRISAQLASASQLGLAWDILHGVIGASKTLRNQARVSDLLVEAKDDFTTAWLSVGLTAWEGNYRDPMDFADHMDTILARNWQTYRVLSRNTVGRINPEETKRINQGRDLRVFNRFEDISQNAPVERGIMVEDFAKKEFQREKDLGKAAEQAGKLTDRAIERSERKGVIHPDRLRSNLDKLDGSRRFSYTNPDTKPTDTAAFDNFIRTNQGDEAADGLRQEFEIDRILKSRKRALTPNL